MDQLLAKLRQTIADYEVRSGDTREDLCALSGVGYSALRCYENDHRPLPAAAVTAICRVTGDLRMLDYMREQATEHRPARGTVTQVAGLAGQMAECTGTVIQQLFSDVADGRIDRDELERLRPALGRLHDLIHRIERTAEGAVNVTKLREGA
jgi:hypothetical protein